MGNVNHITEGEVEFDYYLTLASILDEGYPSIPHVHCETFSNPRSPSDDISKQDESTPKECAKHDALLRVKEIRNE